MPIQMHAAVAKSKAGANLHVSRRLGLCDTASYVFKTYVNVHMGLPGLLTLFDHGISPAGTRIW